MEQCFCLVGTVYQTRKSALIISLFKCQCLLNGCICNIIYKKIHTTYLFTVGVVGYILYYLTEIFHYILRTLNLHLRSSTSTSFFINRIIIWFDCSVVPV